MAGLERLFEDIGVYLATQRAVSPSFNESLRETPLALLNPDILSTREEYIEKFLTGHFNENGFSSDVKNDAQILHRSFAFWRSDQEKMLNFIRSSRAIAARGQVLSLTYLSLAKFSKNKLDNLDENCEAVDEDKLKWEKIKNICIEATRIEVRGEKNHLGTEEDSDSLKNKEYAKNKRRGEIIQEFAFGRIGKFSFPDSDLEALYIKDSFSRWQKEYVELKLRLGGEANLLDAEIIKELTLGVIAKHAEAEFHRALEEKICSQEGTPGHLRYADLAQKWSYIEEITSMASKLPTVEE